ncbi:MAG: ABC transporter permease subunit [Methylococcales bacterium]|nr:ABC transporter permease subunit [Methylococcales bacterium]
MPPNFFNSVLLICQFELKRLFSTRKGLLYIITFAVVWYFILLYPIRYASDLLGRQQSSGHGSTFFEFIGFGSLMNWQIPEFGVYWRFALIMFPILCISITADQTCSDRERGTFRFLTLRISRGRLFFGRFMGAMVIQAILIITTLITTLVLTVYRDGSLLSSAFNSSVAIAVNLLIVLLPFTAMMAALSATIKSAKQSTVWAILIWSFLAGIISGLSSYIPVLDNLKVLIPGYQMTELAQLSEWQPLHLAYVPLLQSFVLLIIGYWIMSRQTL